MALRPLGGSKVILTEPCRGRYRGDIGEVILTEPCRRARVRVRGRVRVRARARVG